MEVNNIFTAHGEPKKYKGLFASFIVTFNSLNQWIAVFVLIGSRNEEHPCIFTVLGRDSASRFATVSKDEILAVNEAAAPPLF